MRSAVPPATEGTIVIVSSPSRSSVSCQVADIFVVEVHVHERAQLAVLCEQVFAQLGIPVTRLFNASPTVLAVTSTVDCFPSIGAERRRYQNFDRHVIPFLTACLLGSHRSLQSFHPQTLAVFFSQQQEGVRLNGLPMFDAGNHVRTSSPVRFVQISARPLCRTIGMGVVETNNVLTRQRRLALNANQFRGINMITVLRRVGARVAARYRRLHRLVAAHRRTRPQARRSTHADRSVPRARAVDREDPSEFSVPSLTWSPLSSESSQNRSLRYLSPESGKMVTTTEPGAADFATRSEPTRAAAAETPTSNPSSPANLRHIECAASVPTPKVFIGKRGIVNPRNDRSLHVLCALNAVEG